MRFGLIALFLTGFGCQSAQSDACKRFIEDCVDAQSSDFTADEKDDIREYYGAEGVCWKDFNLPEQCDMQCIEFNENECDAKPDDD